MSNFTAEIKGRTLEYYDNEHLYVVDGVVLPSITQMLKFKFSGKYSGVPRETLQRAAEAGTAVHEAIQRYCEAGEESDLKEVRNFKFLQKQYRFEVMANEVPVILFLDGQPVSAGRLDLVIRMIMGKDGNLGLADIKRTATLDKEYLAYQLNLYRIAYQQSYGCHVTFLKGVHLRENVRKFVDIPINEEMALQLVREYQEAKK